MKLYVTFNDLINYIEPYDKRIVQRIEQVTGSRLQYGLDTPIYLSDILDSVGSAVTCNLMLYTHDDTRDLQKNIAIELLKAHLFIWANYTDNPAFGSLIDLCENILISGSESEIRRDYCGEVIPGTGTADWIGLIKSRVAEIRVLLGEFGQAAPFVPIHAYWMTNGAPWTDSHIDYYERLGNGRWHLFKEHCNVTDPDSYTYNVGNYPGYSPELIDIVFGNDPDYYLKESEVFKQNGPTSTYYGILCHRYIDQSNGTAPHQGAQAAKMLGNAAIQTGNMVLLDQPLLSSVVVSIRSALLSYASYYRSVYACIIPRLKDMLLNGRFVQPTYTGISDVENAEKAVTDAGLNRRVELLRDIEYVKSYDKNLDGRLTLAERKSLESAVRKQIIESRKAAAKVFYDQVMANYYAMADYDSDRSVGDIIKPYLL